MKILENRKTKFNQLIQLTYERRGVYRVQIWTENNMDWDWIETDQKNAKQIYDLTEHIEDLRNI